MVYKSIEICLAFNFYVYWLFSFVLMSIAVIKNILQKRCAIKYFQKLYEISKTLIRILERSLKEELVYKKVEDFQASIFLKVQFQHLHYSRILPIVWKHLFQGRFLYSCFRDCFCKLYSFPVQWFVLFVINFTDAEFLKVRIFLWTNIEII